MADKIRDLEAKMGERLNEQKNKGNLIFKQDPSLQSKNSEMMKLLKDMVIDMEKRKKELAEKDKTFKEVEQLNNLRKRGLAPPELNEKEIHETKIKQLSDLESGLVVDKKKTLMLSGMCFVLLFLQIGSYVFM
jgi:hypothetical protein